MGGSMTILAFASGNNTPQSSPHEDVTIDLASNALDPALSRPLYAEAIDDNDVDPDFSFAWQIISKPDGSTASLSATNVQNPTLNGIDTWGNYLLFVVATNANNSQTSQANRLYAPREAFVVVRVISARKGLQKPAAGERGYHPAIHEVIGAVESAGQGDHLITDHLDVFVATGKQLDILVSGEYAENPDNLGTSLHTHVGKDIPPSSQVARGSILTTALPLDPLNPKALNTERIVLTATVNHSFNNDGTMTTGIVSHLAGTGAANFEYSAREHCVFAVPVGSGWYVQSWVVAFAAGGSSDPTKGLRARLLTGSSVAFASKNLLLVPGSSERGGSPDFDNGPLSFGELLGEASTVNQNEFIGVQVTSSDPTTPAYLMTATITLVRRV